MRATALRGRPKDSWWTEMAPASQPPAGPQALLEGVVSLLLWQCEAAATAELAGARDRGAAQPEGSGAVMEQRT